MKTIKFITLILFASFVMVAFSESARAGAITFSISDDATGGDCSVSQPSGLGGIWDAATKTCVLNGNVTNCDLPNNNFACITILSDDVTLNCKGDMITSTNGSPTGNGVSITSLSDVKVKRCDIDNFDNGIDVNNSSNITLFYNNFTNTGFNGSGIIFTNTDNSYIIANNIDSTNANAIVTDDTKNNYVIGNSADGTRTGFGFFDCTNDTFIANSAANTSFAFGFAINSCSRSEFINNSASNDKTVGISFLSGSRSMVFANISNGSMSSDGFSVVGVSGFKFEHNIADDNFNFGIDDNSTGKKTAGTANTYEGNTCSGNGTAASDPMGLCN